jgi:radical SAM/Cys-rich protein
MGQGVAARVIGLIERLRPALVDITGGAPELNPSFRPMVEAARHAGARVMDRCNLSVLFTPGQEDLAAFLAAQRVEVTASLPHYNPGPTDRQRGAGVFDRSIDGLRLLNQHGYGRSGLILNLVHNPAGAFLPARQDQLEADYRRELKRLFDVDFDNLFCITNMPIARFAEWLRRSGNYDRYLTTLANAFNPATVSGLMCRNLISIGPDGSLYDCDFNQMLGLRVGDGVPQNVMDFDLARIEERLIATGEHCLGCTAGAGSSCGGETA